MQGVKSVRDVEVSGKRVLLRVDFNVPIANGAVVDDTRIKAALPTINFLHERGVAHIILLAHLGRPEGVVVEELRLKPVEARLRELTAAPFEMQENLRFDPGEEANDSTFAQKLAALGDVFVQDAFADAHREHASIVGVPKLLPSCAGLLLETEIQNLSKALAPEHPALAIVGGAKFETKEPLLVKLLGVYDRVLLGGALADDVLRARGWPVGSSLVSNTPVPVEIASSEKLSIPLDGVVGEDGAHAERVSLVSDIRAGENLVDIGPQTALLWSEEIRNAKFVLWNGPMGVYEKGYVAGTDALAQALADAGVNAVIGGGDTDAALSKFTFDPAKVFLSTGGGAMLQFLANSTLPGIEALKNR